MTVLSEAAEPGLGRAPAGPAPNPVIKMSAPSMEERKACWGAKDEYWKCLDENTEDASKCQKFRHSYESRCPQQWVKYFDKRRDFLKYKEQLEAGQYQPPQTTEKS
ncbi:cytochrome c oxidase assembly factor 6 homolog isoform X1 [Emydura macquarii macquarii]|uniref:cytochrome c oxidase assembly factor 6 homolog isoform X1 n=2 Tax=Emydura macquarii macquarii TaxID=1129001 RepID=UPI00352B248A